MKFLRSIFIQAKISSKNLGLVFSIFLLPLMMSIGVNFGMGLNDSHDTNINNIIVINNDLTIDVSDIFNQPNTLVQYSNDFNESLEKDFSYNIANGIIPIITSHQLNNNTIDQVINDAVIRLVKKNLLESNNINVSDVLDNNLISVEMIDYDGYSLDGNILAAIFVLYTLFTSSGTIASNIFNLKENKVLSRMLTTNNNGFTIIATYCIGNFLLQTTLSFFAALILQQFFGFTLGNMNYFILCLILISIFSISFALFIARTFKKDAAVKMVSTLGGLMFFFAGMVNMIHKAIELDAIFIVISKFSPFWWAMDIFMGNNIILATTILLIMNVSLILLSSINLNKFVSD